MYKAGTEMDPVSLAVALDSTAQLPALPDLGSTAPPAAASASPSAAPAPVAKDAESSSTALFIALAVAVLVLAGGGAYLVVRKRRTAPASTAGSDPGAAGPVDAPTDAPR